MSIFRLKFSILSKLLFPFFNSLNYTYFIAMKVIFKNYRLELPAMFEEENLKEKILEKLRKMKCELERMLTQIEQIEKQYKLGLLEYLVIVMNKISIILMLKSVNDWEKIVESMSKEELEKLVKINKELKELVK